MADLRVFLADDHAVVREGLKKIVEDTEGLCVAGESGDGLTACHEIVRLRPDIAVMDISMPGLNGLEVTRRLKKMSPELRVLVLTVHEEIEYVKEILHAGASGYVLKRTAGSELVRALNAVASGGSYFDPALAEKLLAKSTNELPEGNTQVRLSAREAEVVRLVAEGHSNKEIAALLQISDKSVETYRSRSMSKLGFRGRADFVTYALQQGWLKSQGEIEQS